MSETNSYTRANIIVTQRTWEDPTFFHPDAEGCRGDNDPVDVCEIGMRIVQPGVSSSFLSWNLQCLYICIYPAREVNLMLLIAINLIFQCWYRRFAP